MLYLLKYKCFSSFLNYITIFLPLLLFCKNSNILKEPFRSFFFSLILSRDVWRSGIFFTPNIITLPIDKTLYKITLIGPTRVPLLLHICQNACDGIICANAKSSQKAGAIEWKAVFVRFLHLLISRLTGSLLIIIAFLF